MIVLTFLTLNSAFCQEKLVKDIDFDKVMDTVYLDANTSELICRLSGLGFKKIKSDPMETAGDNYQIKSTKNGFEYQCNWMRAGFAAQFRYDKVAKKVQLIGMSRYEFGNASNDGSGESSINLLTTDYIGNWNYFDQDKMKLVKIPAIKSKMPMKTVFLEDFSEGTYTQYADRCAELYNKNKKRLLNK